MGKGGNRILEDWRQSDAGTDSLKRALQKSGVPLETKALNAVRDFCLAHPPTSGLGASDLGPALWRNSEDEAYRDIDAAALLQQNVEFGVGHVRVRILAYLFVEAKYREDVEWFAFESPHMARLPAASNGTFSRSVTEIYSKSAQSLPLSRLATLKTGNETGLAGDSVPYKDENLAQNASAALADLLRYNVEVTTLMPVPSLGSDLRDAMLGRFKQRFQRGSFSDIDKFLAELTVQEHQEFLNSQPHIPPITICIYAPLMVVNGRMNRVSMGPDGNIQDILPADFSITGERLPKWPPDRAFVSLNAHFPLFVSSAEGLSLALEAVYAYVGRVRDAYCEAAVRGHLNGAAFESAVASVIDEQLDRPPF